MSFLSLLSFSKMYISAVSWLSVIEFHKKHIEVGGKAAYDFRLIGLELWLPWQ